MNIKIPYISFTIFSPLVAVFLLLGSCEKFFDSEQPLIVDESNYFADWNEYRAAELGLYALQQELVTQLVVLGELRGDLVTVTENADRDLLEVNLHQVYPDNKYGSPLNFSLIEN